MTRHTYSEREPIRSQYQCKFIYIFISLCSAAMLAIQCKNIANRAECIGALYITDQTIHSNFIVITSPLSSSSDMNKLNSNEFKNAMHKGWSGFCFTFCLGCSWLVDIFILAMWISLRGFMVIGSNWTWGYFVWWIFEEGLSYGYCYTKKYLKNELCFQLAGIYPLGHEHYLHKDFR